MPVRTQPIQLYLKSGASGAEDQPVRQRAGRLTWLEIVDSGLQAIQFIALLT